MNCKKCNSFIDPGSYFCGECGTMILENVVEGMKKKDEGASRIFIENTQQKLCYTASSIIKDASLAEDIVQETYLTAFNSLDSLMDDTKILSWIMRITVNKCKNYLSSKQNNMFSDFSSLENVDDIKFEDTIEDERMEFVPDKRFNYEQIKEGVNAILNELPENQRLAIFLYYLDEFKVKEISEIMDVPEGTVKSLLNYGRKAIKNKIEELRKNNKSFYSVVPMPFLSWFLEEQAKAIQVPASMEQSIIKSLTLSGASKAATTTSAASSASVKAAVSMGARTISAKMIVGITAGVVGIGAVSGYAINRVYFDQKTEEASETVVTETSYSVLEDAVSEFDFAPIALNGDAFVIDSQNLTYDSIDDTAYTDDGTYYVTSVNGKFGLLNNDNEWIVTPEYSYVTYYWMAHEYRASNDLPESCRYMGEGQKDQYGIYHSLSAKAGGYNNITLFEEDGELKPYMVNWDPMSTEMAKEPYKSKKMFLSYQGMTWAEYDGKWYLIDPNGKLYGPYKYNEIPCYEAYVLTQEANGGGNLYYNYVSLFHSIFYESEDDKYRVYNEDASKASKRLYDEVQPASRFWIKAKYEDKTIFIDQKLNEYVLKNIENVSEPLQDKSYAKIDNEWKYIEINQEKGE